MVMLMELIPSRSTNVLTYEALYKEQDAMLYSSSCFIFDSASFPWKL